MTYCLRILGSDMSSLRTKQVMTPTTTRIRCLELTAPVDLPNVVAAPPWCSHQVAAGSLLSGLAFALLPWPDHCFFSRASRPPWPQPGPLFLVRQRWLAAAFALATAALLP